jgi:hypothetical protein
MPNKSKKSARSLALFGIIINLILLVFMGWALLMGQRHLSSQQAKDEKSLDQMFDRLDRPDRENPDG